MDKRLFSNSKNPKLLRFLLWGDEWHETYVVEFIQDEIQDNYVLYWGNTYYVEKDRKQISWMITMLFLHDKNDEWREEIIDQWKSPIDLTKIEKWAKDEISKRMKENQ